MTTKNKYQYFQISYVIFSLCVFFVFLYFSQNFTTKRPIDTMIIMMSATKILKLIWIADLGFFVSLTVIIALTHLFLKRNHVVGWYLGFMLFLIIAYSVALLLYYYEGSTVRFIFYSLNNTAHLGGIICALRVYQNTAGYHDYTKFHRLTLFATLGLLSCNIGYFVSNQIVAQCLHLIFTISFIVPIIESFKVLKRAVKEKKIEQSLLNASIFLFIVSLVRAYPITQDNVEIVLKLRLYNNFVFPLAVSIFLALVFADNIKKYDLAQKKMEALILEKQAILEAQNETLLRQVAEQTSELRVLNATKDRLFSIIGHDLRSPIASLKEILLLFDNQQLSRKEFDELLQHLQKNVDDVHGMLENLLQWSLSQIKGMKPSLKSFEMNEVIEQNLEFFKYIVKQKNIKFQTDLTENLMVCADENHLRVVIRNLLYNALKFTPQYGYVSVNGRFVNNFVEVQIINSGLGISAEELTTIFSSPKLKRGTAGEKGTGLGLILCRDLIKQNRGEIRVRSELSKATTFEILIPQKAEIL